MTNQEMFDLIYDVFIVLNTKRSVKDGQCYYGKQYNGIGCVIAVIFTHINPNFNFEYWMEYKSLFALCVDSYEFLSIYNKIEDKKFLSELQNWHDEQEFVYVNEQYKHALLFIGKMYEVNIPEEPEYELYKDVVALSY